MMPAPRPPDVSPRGGPPLRVAPRLADVTRYRALFPDDLAACAPLLEGAAVQGMRCLDLQTRTGHLAAALVARGAARVWASASAGEALYEGGAHHLIRADLAWLCDHPDLRAADAPFDWLVCGSGLHWALPLASPLRAAGWRALASLLAPGGRLVCAWPSRRAPLRPRWRALGEGVSALDQRLGDTHWQCRAAPGIPPWVREGACLSVSACARALRAAGFSSVAVSPLSPDHVRLEAHR
jgi:SAM-dependent methyltransferase